MKEIIKNNKSVLIVFIGILILVVMGIILIVRNDNKTFDLASVSSQFTGYYSDINLEELEKENIDYYFSIPTSEIENALLLSNFNPNEYSVNDEEEITPCLLLLLSDLSKEELNEYYDSLNAFIISYTNSDSQNKELVSLYKNAILRRGYNYIYLIMGENNKILESELMRLYK